MLRAFTSGLIAIQVIVTIAGVWGAFAWGIDVGQARAAATFNTAIATQRQRMAVAAEQQLRQALHNAGIKEREFMAQQQQLNTRISQLQERLNEPYVNQVQSPLGEQDQPADCRFSLGWLRDYNAAFGVSATPTSTNHSGGAETAAWPSTGSAAEYASAGITQRQLLVHAQQYGHWCITNVQRLVALQQLIDGSDQ